jgi:hypothetical protein
MAPVIFQVFPLLIAALALATAIFPKKMSSWRMRGPQGDTRIEPSEGRLLMMRVMGLVVAAIAIFMTLRGLF